MQEIILFLPSLIACITFFLWIKEVENSKRLKEKNISLMKDLEFAGKKEQELQKFSNLFKAVSVDVLQQASTSFLDLANAKFEKLQEGARFELSSKAHAVEELVKPIKEYIQNVDKKMGEFDKGYHASHASLQEQIKGMGALCLELTQQTSNLSKALKAPHVRGKWGEVQLKRVVELAGMVAYCDFVEQKSVCLDEKRIRPDLIVNLPNQRNIVIDAKTPIHAFLEAFETSDEVIRGQRLKDHARHLRNHIAQLSNKSYWEQFSPAPEFVVLFIPGESFFSASLEQDPSLIEIGAEQKVILATPTTLIALLKAIAFGWREESLAENAKAVVKLGKEFHDRLYTMVDHFNTLKKGLEGAVDGYNKAMRSFETRVIVSARKFNELQVTTENPIDCPERIDKAPVNINL